MNHGLQVSFAQSQQENSHWAKDKIKTLFLLPHLLSVRNGACRGQGWLAALSHCALSALDSGVGPSFNTNFLALYGKEKSQVKKRQTSLWLTVSEVSLCGCVAPSLLGMWQGRNIMTEGKLFTSCRQGRDWEEEERCGRENRTHVL